MAFIDELIPKLTSINLLSGRITPDIIGQLKEAHESRLILLSLNIDCGLHYTEHNEKVQMTVDTKNVIPPIVATTQNIEFIKAYSDAIKDDFDCSYFEVAPRESDGKIIATRLHPSVLAYRLDAGKTVRG